MLEINDRAEDLIKGFEKLRLKAYQGAADAEGVFTIGWGHVITGYEDPDLFKSGQLMSEVGITTEQAEELFKQDIEKFIMGVTMRLNVDKRKALTDDQFGALVSFAYNIGLGGFGSSRVRSTINQANPTDAWQSFSHFISSNGQHQNGLIRRRAAEAALYKSDYSMLASFMGGSSQKIIDQAKTYLLIEED